MNVNFGLFPPPPPPPASAGRLKGPERGAAKRRAISERALADLDIWLNGSALAAAE
jgi:methylenetetrahydrofolate--tRNA-(uracil-5-)-methyltransferase